MTTIRMGYLGYATINQVGYFLTGSSLNAVQTVNAPDLVMAKEVKRGWNMSKVEIGGNFTGPLHENAASLLKQAINRNTTYADHMAEVVTVGIAFFGGGSANTTVAVGQQFGNCQIGSLALTATAGDVINFTADFMGAQAPVDFSSVYEGIDCAKLLTWDRMAVDPGVVSPVQSVTITFNNNLERQYTIESTITNVNSLYPVDITAGIREVTGTFSLYATDDHSIRAGGTFFPFPDWGADSYPDYQVTDLINIGFQIDPLMSAPLQIEVRMHRPEASASTSAAIYSLSFVSVCTINNIP
jgi:hypothetical protein